MSHKEDGVYIFDDKDAQFNDPTYSDNNAQSDEMPKKKRASKSDLELAAEGAANIGHGIAEGAKLTGQGFNIVKNKIFPNAEAKKAQELAQLQAEVQKLQAAKSLDTQIEALKKQKAELEKKDKLAMA